VPAGVGLAAAWATVVALRAGLVRGEWVSLTMCTAVILVAVALFVSPWFILVPGLLVGALVELLSMRGARHANATDVSENRAKLTEVTSALEAAIRDADEGLDAAQATIDTLDAELAKLATLDVDKWRAGRADREEAAAHLARVRKKRAPRSNHCRANSHNSTLTLQPWNAYKADCSVSSSRVPDSIPWVDCSPSSSYSCW
jgi:hypothetical protein